MKMGKRISRGAKSKRGAAAIKANRPGWRMGKKKLKSGRIVSTGWQKAT